MVDTCGGLFTHLKHYATIAAPIQMHTDSERTERQTRISPRDTQSYNSGSMSGGAIADDVNFSVPASAYHNSYGTAYGFYLYAATYPTTDTTLVDYDMRTTGYNRMKLTANGTVVLEIAYGNTSVSITSNPVPQSTWVWVSTYTHSINNYVTAYLTVEGVNQQVLTSASQGGLSGFYNIDDGPGPTFLANFGLGVSLSSSYANVPNSANLKISIFDARYGTPVFTTADVSSGQQDYMMRQTPGVSTQLYDSSAGSYHLVAGPQGLTLNADGPFPSGLTIAPTPVVTATPTPGSQSMSGGGTASNVNFTVPASSYHDSYGTAYSFFLYASSYPTVDTTLVDYDMRTTGYHRMKLTSLGTIVLEIAYGGTSVAITTTAAIPLNTWVWISTYSHSVNSYVTTYLNVYGPGEQALSAGSVGGLSGFYSIDSGPGPTYPANFGWGVSVSSDYANAANTPGLKMSKFDAHYGAQSAPTGDVTNGQQDYMVRQPVGAVTQL